MSFTKALVAIMLAMITKEAPGIQRQDKRLKAYEREIATMVEVDKKVIGIRTDLFDDPRIARAFIGSVRFSESRFRVKPSDGDCKTLLVDYGKKIRAFKDAGKFIPMWMYNTTRKSCPAKGPMQVTYGPHNLIGEYWAEGKALSIPKHIPLKLLRDIEMNVRLGYIIHWHWKTEAEKKARTHAKWAKKPYVAPLPGAWFAAYRRGRLTSYFGQAFRLDIEARTRCRRMTHIMRELERMSTLEDSNFTFSVPANWRCGHEAPKKRKQEIKVASAK